MYTEIYNYQFKNSEAKAQGIEFIKNSYIPFEEKKHGFIKSLMVDGDSDDIFLMLEFKVRENCYGKSMPKDDFLPFAELLEKAPAKLSGLNKAYKEFWN